jgi:hypothetical protein
MFLLRVQLPDTPGALGRLATAMGGIGANIRALQIIDETHETAVDDFMIDLPARVLPDTLVAACHSVAGVRVLWVQRHHSDWSVATDLELLDHMESEPGRSAELLVEGAPQVFHSTWAALLTQSEPVTVLAATERAPDFEADGVAALGDLTAARVFALPPEWLPQWGETLIALAPLSGGRVVVLGRLGGPAYLPSELTRLRHLAALAG